MAISFDPSLDLTISRVIKAPRPVIWSAWTDPASFEQWWVPAAAKFTTGGALTVTEQLAKLAEQRAQ